MQNRIFNQRETNKIFEHIPVNTLRWWASQGFCGWVNEVKDGRGISREYSVDNLYQIGVTENLSALDIKPSIIKAIMAKLGDKPPMDNFIIITKHPVRSREVGPIGYRLRKSASFTWHNDVIPITHIGLIKAYRPHNLAIIIIVDLAAIKVFVDSLVLEHEKFY